MLQIFYFFFLLVMIPVIGIIEEHLIKINLSENDEKR
jgi:hypothetical protein